MRKHKKNKVSKFISQNFFEILAVLAVGLYVGLHVYVKDFKEPRLQTLALHKINQPI